MRNAGRLKLGYYPLPIYEARTISALLVASGPYAAIDPCAGDGAALLEITQNTGASSLALNSTRIAPPHAPRAGSRLCTGAHSNVACRPRHARSCT